MNTHEGDPGANHIQESAPEEMGDRVFETNNFVVLTGSANPELAQEVAHELHRTALDPITVFADREVRVKISENLRKRDVYIIQPTSTPANDHLVELFLMIDAANRASAGEITAVLPYFGYSRQDRKEQPRVPIAAAFFADMIEHAGARRIVTVDIHAEQEEGFIKGPWDNLRAEYAFVPEIQKRGLINLVVASPDEGGVKRATRYGRQLRAGGLAIVYKERDLSTEDESGVLAMTGDVEGKDVVIVDDMISTAGTITNAANMMKERGAQRILAVTTHGVFSSVALDRISKSALDEVLITNTIAQPIEVKNHPKISIVSVAPMIAEAIRCNQTGESLSSKLFL